MSAHTPGPWFSSGKTWDCRCVVETADGGYLALVGPERVNPRATNDIAEANADLIAAAPALLIACRAIRRYCPSDPDVNREFNAAWGLLESAIASAEGGH